jgi:tRNA-specific 2-thiouridylase
MSKTVLVALSGGIDSTMTALMLIEQGYDVTGVHFQFFDNPSARVEKIANQLRKQLIEHDARALFQKEVIGYFAEFYLAGKTPSPCVYCNPNIKWKLLLQLANRERIQNIATGHYINIKKEKGIYRIYKGVDHTKDQSYYLWGLRQEALSRAITPMGQLSKAFLKEQIKNTIFRGLVNKKESAGLCFAKNRSCSDILRDYIPGLDNRIGPGKVVNKNGEQIGQHHGYVYYTIGQKRNLTLNTKEELSVTRIDPENNVLEVNTWDSLYKNEFLVEDYYFADISELDSLKSIQVSVRGFGLNPSGNCTVIRENDNTLHVHLENPAWASAPGQPAVFYSGEKLLGGGIIS